MTEFLADRIRWGVLFVFVMLAGIAGLKASSVQAHTTTGGHKPAAREGFSAPDFSLESLSGQVINLSDYRGQVVILNLWASWCPPCRAEMPAIQRLYEALQDQGLVVLALNTTFQDSRSAAASFAAEYKLTFPILLDEDGQVSNTYLLRALPTTFFIDRQGVIQKVVIGGPMSEVMLQSMVTELLEADS